MRPKWTTFLTLCSICLLSLLCYSVYSFYFKNRYTISISTIMYGVQTFDENEEDTSYLISNRKKHLHMTQNKQQKYEKQKKKYEQENDGDSSDNIEEFENNYSKRQKYSKKPQKEEQENDNDTEDKFEEFENQNQKQQRYRKQPSKQNEEYDDDESKDDNGKSKQGKKYLIYLCMYNRSCSGWADRQRAIISGFLLAQVKNRTFGIMFTSPCDLRNFFEPNEYNWIVDEKELVGLTTATPPDSFLRHIERVDFDEAYPEDLVFFRTNRDLFLAIKNNPLHAKSVPRWARYSKPVAFKNAWNILMKRTRQFDRKLSKLMSVVPHNGQFVCAHVRLSKSPTMPMETRVINTLPSVKYLWAFLDSNYQNASRIFIATDSMDVRKWARRHFKDKEMDTGETILHIEKQKQKKNACDGFESVLLDQEIMIQCDVLVCSYSNICKHAVYFSGIREHVFLFRFGKVGPIRNAWPEI